MLIAILISLLVGFAGGWAFFKHRQDIKDAAQKEAQDILKSAKDKLS